MSFPEAKLRTGLPATEAKAFAAETTRHPEWVHDLIRISAHPEGGTVPRKAAWVLRHVALKDPSCVAGQARAMLDAVDSCQDTSVHREVLKALLEIPKEELHTMGEELYDLGLGLCADPSLPVAMVHVGVMLLHASGQTLGEEVALVWRERGAQAETTPLARFLSKQLAAMRSRR